MNYQQKVLEDKKLLIKERLASCISEMSSIKSWIDSEKLRCRERGVQNTSTELVKRKTRLRDLGVKHLRLTNQMAEVNLLLKKEIRSQQIWQDKFVDIAKEVIDPDTFKIILERAREGYCNT